MATKENYLALVDRLTNLNERRAVLVSAEEAKREQREGVIEVLKEYGIDTDNPEAEIERLEKEIQEQYDQAKARVDEFEKALDIATGKTPHPADVLEDHGVEVPSETRAALDEEVSTNDLDLD